ncbi:MAG TPA: hypothetical protein VKA36_11115, partial [Solirubrobacterales bacterium]|nr:hypothetical protein [Solirubrobacterales bacterium]
FMAGYLFNPGDLEPPLPRRDPVDDTFLFDQGPTRGLSKIQFADWLETYKRFEHVPNVAVFTEQAASLKDLLTTAPPDEHQQKDLDYLLTLGELFSLIPYGQLILEQAELTELATDTLDQIFDVFVRDFSAYAIELHGKNSATAEQQDWALRAVTKPATDEARFEAVVEKVCALAGAYEMNP